MESESIQSALRQIRTLYTVGTLATLSDAQLLERFLARNGVGAEDAFAALVERHGPTVLGVCRRMLPSAHDCEDAFQATFLVLARRAASIGRRERLANWLYGVAVRTAKEARRRAAQQHAGERRLMELSKAESEPTENDSDLLACLDEELNRLPERYRAALVACELQGKSRQEAAQQLGRPEGTLSTHLARGRKLLRERLVRRGVSLGVGPFAGLPRPIAAASVPERLIDPVVEASLSYASGKTAAGMVPAAVATLAERVLRMMFLTRLALLMASLIAAGTGAAAAVLLGLTVMAANPSNPDPPRPVGPDAVAQQEIPLERLPKITGRLVDAQTGKGIAGVKLMSLLHEDGSNSNIFCGEATSDADGRYTIAARPGKIFVELRDVPKSHLGLDRSEFPKLEVRADQTCPDIKLPPATVLDGVVVDRAGKPVVGAEVFAVVPDPPGARSHDNSIKTGPGGAFHIEQLDPDDTVSLRARSGDATTSGAVIVQPDEIKAKAKITLTVDPAQTFKIRGLVTDLTGKRIAGADMMLRWHRSFVTRKFKGSSGIGSPLEIDTTSASGLFVFRNLWAGDRYSIVIEAKGHARIETPEVTGKAGEIHDIGKIVLVNTGGFLAGRLVGSDGKPIDGANVFNRGDAPDLVATSPDSQGRFRLAGMFPGPKYAFIRKDGYRFTGIKADDDAGGLTITLRKTSEPHPSWKPGLAPSDNDQRAFAKQVLIRLWEKYGADPEKTGAFQCIGDMAEIDPNLALEWSHQHGDRFADVVRRSQARKLAGTDAPRALAMLQQKPDSDSQSILQALAERFAETDPGKALLFAGESAVQARGLLPPERTAAMAQAGALLVKLGRAELGRTLLDEAAREAAKLGFKNHDGYYRSIVAETLAPFDLNQALALIEPFEDKENEVPRKSAIQGWLATAIGKHDTARAIAMIDSVSGRAFNHYLGKTEIAYRIGADRPDEAIKIIDGMKGDRWSSEYQAAAFGWLAVALAPRDRQRAFGLIDRALAMMLENLNARGPEDEMAVAARIAICARRIGYPDMDSVIMRVMALRSAADSSFTRRGLLQFGTQAALALVLLDPDSARTVLEDIEARAEGDPMKEWNVRAQWLIAWAQVDIKKASALVDAVLADLDGAKEVKLRDTGLFEMVEFLTTPPDRRPDALGERSSGGFWWPAYRR